jgi:hypothetical protein
VGIGLTVAEKLGGSRVGRPVESALPDWVLRQRISDLGKLERRCFATRKRFEFYRYLAAVFEFYAELKRTNGIEKSVRRMAELFNLDSRQRVHPIRLIIDASSQADSKTKSRWTRALRFAWHERHRWSDLEAFLRGNGGPAGCASQFAALHPRLPSGCVRAGGDSRVPRIPMYVSRDMMR